MAITAEEMARRMGRGINLGQTFEVDSQSRSPTRTKAMISKWALTGFKHVRIPVTWYRADGSCKLNDSVFMTNLDAAVYHVVNCGMIVVINQHHEDWLEDNFDSDDTVICSKFYDLVRKIALRYNSVPQSKFVMELHNEPHGIAFGHEGGGATDPKSAKAISNTRAINKIGYDAVRSVSQTRIVSFQPNAKGSIYQLLVIYPNAASLPGSGQKNEFLLVQCHCYNKWSHCGQDGNDNDYKSKPDPLAALRSDIDSRYSMITKWFNAVKGDTALGLYMGEIGVGRLIGSQRNNDLTREYYRYTTRKYIDGGHAIAAWCDSNNAWFTMTEYNAATKSAWYPYGLVPAMFK